MDQSKINRRGFLRTLGTAGTGIYSSLIRQAQANAAQRLR
ncbi:hypothetical protein HDIA_1711 [Hartmannibacter diazotrophicus]|uniref:Uncharacterized protein n=1 Tax=Hartmannibacter diazotrophicus TaxID=1482074 RepID=A0A2C9D4J9_9HYPH|nr:hypothetical protein HDIA_1711 [Hartmannibacter diazotrophicus]